MKTDRYAKIVLTVIAVCLTIIVLGQFGLVGRVNAATATGTVRVSGEPGS